MMRLTILVALIAAALGLMLAPLYVYFFLGNFHGELSNNPSDWGNFGDFAGGIIGPLLSFLSIVLLVITIHQQAEANEIAIREQNTSQHIRLLADLLNEIKVTLSESVHVQGDTVELRAALRNELMIDTNDKEILTDLVFLVFRYCEAAALYRGNISEHFDCKTYEMQGRRLIKLLERNKKQLDANHRIQLEFADMHIRGESQREQAKFS